MPDQPRHVIGHQLLGADDDIDRERAFLTPEQFFVTRVVAGADAGNARRAFIEHAPHDLAGDHVDLIAVGQGDENIGVSGTGRFQRRRKCSIADHGADVQPILQVTQQLIVDVDHRDLVCLLPCKMVNCGSADLAGAENNNVHWSFRRRWCGRMAVKKAKGCVFYCRPRPLRFMRSKRATLQRFEVCIG